MLYPPELPLFSKPFRTVVKHRFYKMQIEHLEFCIFPVCSVLGRTVLPWVFG